MQAQAAESAGRRPPHTGPHIGGEGLLQQLQAPLLVALTHLQAAQFGAGIGIAWASRQVGFHRCAQPGGFVACRQELRAVAVVE